MNYVWLLLIVIIVQQIQDVDGVGVKKNVILETQNIHHALSHVLMDGFMEKEHVLIKLELVLLQILPQK
jgi:hypothetical protein